ncbi:MAG: DUF3943 domain-containing protein [Spirochaetota bacterium]|nr:DUF3943 domain-containing protein [Spirochaetota bacterium]
MDINSPVLKLMQNTGLFNYHSADVNYLSDRYKLFDSNDQISIISNSKNYEGADYIAFDIYSKDNQNQQFRLNWDIRNDIESNSLRDESMKKIMNFVMSTRGRDINEVILNDTIYSKEIKNFNLAFYDDEGGSHTSNYSITFESSPSFQYRFLRTSVEIIFLNGLGVANYWINKHENEVDWEYGYSWKEQKRKVEEGWSLDTNNFRTNTVYHIYSGAVYYQAARSNGFGYSASTAFAFAGSLMWEYFGEFHEQASANDMIFTTMGGAILGEALRNASIYVERRFKVGLFGNIFAFLLDPLRIINKYIDSKMGDDYNFNVTFSNPAQTILGRNIDDIVTSKDGR